MRLGIISDSHGNRKLLFQAVDLLTEQHQAELLLHLGDDYEDAVEVKHAGYDVLMVPGLWCAAYRSIKVPNTLLQDFAGVRIGCAHTPEEVIGLRNKAEILLHGHTHTPEIKLDKHGIVMNPGHLKAARDRGSPASCGLIDIKSKAVNLHIFTLDGKVIEQCTVKRDELTKLSHPVLPES